MFKSFRYLKSLSIFILCLNFCKLGYASGSNIEANSSGQTKRTIEATVSRVVYTDRLIVRPIAPADLPTIGKFYRSHPKIEEYYASDADKIEESLSREIQRESGGTFSLEEKTSHKVVGFVTVKPAYVPTSFISYVLDPQYWNQGLMTEGVGAVLEMLYSDSRTSTIRAEVDSCNIASGRLLERLGFQEIDRTVSEVSFALTREGYVRDRHVRRRTSEVPLTAGIDEKIGTDSLKVRYLGDLPSVNPHDTRFKDRLLEFAPDAAAERIVQFKEEFDKFFRYKEQQIITFDEWLNHAIVDPISFREVLKPLLRMHQKGYKIDGFIYVVLEDGSLRIAPRTIADGVDTGLAKHLALSNGKPVVASGELKFQFFGVDGQEKPEIQYDLFSGTYMRGISSEHDQALKEKLALYFAHICGGSAQWVKKTGTLDPQAPEQLFGRAHCNESP